MNILRDNKVDRDSTRDIVMHGRRVVDAAASSRSTDYVIRKELDLLREESVSRSGFAKFLTGITDFIISKISPPVDSTTAITVTKADRTTPVAYIDTTNGRVGIGVVPVGILHLRGVYPFYYDRVNSAHFAIRSGNGTVAAPTALTNGDDVGTLSFQGYDGTSWTTATATGLHATATENWNNTSHGTKISLSVTPNGTTAAVKALEINQNGNMAFFNGTPAPQQVLNAYATAPATVAYTGINNLGVGNIYAQVADLNILRADYENLRLMVDDLRTKLLASTIVA